MSVELIIGIILLLALVVAALIYMYRIVPPSQAHYVTSASKTFVASPDEKIRGDKGSRWYFLIPILRTIRVMDLRIKELVFVQETYEKNQARYNVKVSTKYRIVDVQKAAETFTSEPELEKQLEEVIRASVRAVTVRFDVVEARANKQKMAEEVEKEMVDDLGQWGLKLISFQLVDFQDTATSNIISDISKRREVEIESTTRERNAEKIKQARIKEAEAEEKARQREIEKDEVIAKREQEKEQMVFEKQKLAQEEHFKVVQVQVIKQAEIDKEKAIVEANQKKETEEIIKEQKHLEGQGDRLRAEEAAKGEAAPIREKGYAEADAKEKLQAALNKFEDKAIRALVAEQIVEKDRQVGIEAAKALEKADLKVFAGDGSKDAIDLGKIITAIGVANPGAMDAIINKIGRPNELVNFGEDKTAGVSKARTKLKKV